MKKFALLAIASMVTFNAYAKEEFIPYNPLAAQNDVTEHVYMNEGAEFYTVSAEDFENGKKKKDSKVRAETAIGYYDYWRAYGNITARWSTMGALVTTIDNSKVPVYTGRGNLHIDMPQQVNSEVMDLVILLNTNDEIITLAEFNDIDVRNNAGTLLVPIQIPKPGIITFTLSPKTITDHNFLVDSFHLLKGK